MLFAMKILSNKIVKNILLAGLTAVIILFIVLWSLKIYTNHGEKIETPNFLGLSLADGQQLAYNNNLTLVVDTVFNSAAPKGTIFLQNPTAYSDSTQSWVKSGRKIYVTAVRNSVQMLALPDVDGAELVVIPRLNGRFTIKKEYKDGPEKVLFCEYQGEKVVEGDLIPRDGLVTVYIGKKAKSQPVLIPNLRGLTINEANLKLTDKGIGIMPLINDPQCKTALDSSEAKIYMQQPAYFKGAKIMQGEDIVVTLTCGALPDTIK